MVSRKLVFFGTAGVCIPFLDILRQRFELSLIVTQPDAHGGRDRQLLEPPVKRWAHERDIPCRQPDTLRDDSLTGEISALQPFVAVAIAYGKMIPAALFRLPVYGTVNVHFSLLPRYRGAAPVQRALEAGETLTGLTLFAIDAHMDAGPIWGKLEIPICCADTSTSLQARLAAAGAPFLADMLEEIRAGRMQPIPQDGQLATLAPAVRKEEGRIDWHLPAPGLINRLRAFTPWPGLFFQAGARTFRVTRASAENVSDAGEPCPETGTNVFPGRILAIERSGLLVACGAGTRLCIAEFQPAGKKPMQPFDYCLGNRLPDDLT